MISLLDQIAVEEQCGDWRIEINTGDVEALIEDAHGIRLKKNRVVQTGASSKIRFRVQVREDELLLVRVSYTGAWNGEGSVQTRLKGRHSSVASSTPLNRTWAEFTIESPAGGAESLEIIHTLPKGTELPIGSVLALAMSDHTVENKRLKAQSLLKWVSQVRSPYAVKSLARRKFPLSLAGCTREVVVLASGDTVEFVAGDLRGDYRLQFWPVMLDIPGLSGGKLVVEVLLDDGWKEAASWSSQASERGAWGKVTVDTPDVACCQMIRVAFAGGDGIICLGEPVLLPMTVQTDKKNLIVIDLDTMRSDRLGSYGYQTRPTSARLDSILDDKSFFVFRNAYSSAAWTLPATAKFLTSRYRDIHFAKTVPSSYTTLAEILRNEGYYCAAVTGGGPLRMSGFEQGFHDYYWTWWYGKAEKTVVPAIDWLKRQPFGESPLFLFLQTFESHAPYTRGTFCNGLEHGRLGDLKSGEKLMPNGFTVCSELTAEELLYVEAAYDGGVHHACRAVANLFEAMDELGLWDNTVVVILSDHGEEFWEHFPMFGDHGHSLYGEQINVPFMLYDPDLTPGGLQYVSDEVTNVDLVPTVLDLLGIDTALPFDGTSLRPLLQGQEIKRTLPILATLSVERSFERAEISRACIIAKGKKFISPWFDSDGGASENLPEPEDCRYYPPADELFSLDEDPAEGHNLFTVDTAAADTMKTLLYEAYRNALPPHAPETISQQPVDLSPDLRRQLEALGYVPD